MSANNARSERRAELHAELEQLRGRYARSNDAKTRARLAQQIERVQGRIARA